MVLLKIFISNHLALVWFAGQMMLLYRNGQPFRSVWEHLMPWFIDKGPGEVSFVPSVCLVFFKMETTVGN